MNIRHSRTALFFLLVLLTLSFITSAPANFDEPGQLRPEEFFEKYRGAQVFLSTQISIRKQNEFVTMFTSNWADSSGILVRDEDGTHLLTVAHYLFGDDRVVVNAIAFFPSECKVVPQNLTVKGWDAEVDLALFTFNDQEAVKDLPVLPWGSTKNLKVGQMVFSQNHQSDVGGYLGSVGRVVSKDGCDVSATDKRTRIIMTDFHGNVGMSGSPLCNRLGELVGINVGMIGPQRQQVNSTILHSVASSIEDIKVIYPKLKRGGKVIRPPTHILFGTSYQMHELNFRHLGLPSRPKIEGVYVATLAHGSEPEKAGLKVGDVVLSCNDRLVGNINDLYRQIYLETDIGEEIVLEVDRFGERKEIAFVFGKGGHEKPEEEEKNDEF